VAAPSWRPDIEGKADLVEEVVRIIGLDKVPFTPLPRTGTVRPEGADPRPDPPQPGAPGACRPRFNEAVTWSFIAKDQAEPSAAAHRNWRWPIRSPRMSDMRPSLLPGLLAAAQRNADRGYPDVALFEVGQMFADDTPEGQKHGRRRRPPGHGRLDGAGRHWSGSRRQMSTVYDAKADATAALAAIGAPVDKLQVYTDAPATFHPGRSGA
jgi:phenylalanyl-tRNA synthetase beta chain